MTFPKTSWNYSPETEAARIMFTASQIKNGFYEDKGFFVVPQLMQGISTAVHFPRGDFLNMSNFWEHANISTSLIQELLANQKSEFTRKLISCFAENECNYQKIKTLWTEKSDIFWDQINTLFPDYIQQVKKLEIRPTLYGTAGSCFITKDVTKIIIYIRSDFGAEKIPGAVLIDLMYRNYNWASENWEKNMSTKKFLLSQTNLQTLFPNPSKDLFDKLQQNQKGEIAKLSGNYLAELGFPTDTKVENEKGLFHVQGKALNLTKSQAKVMRILFDHRGQLVSFDQLAEVIWADKVNDKFSLSAIAKHIERLRKKIQETGLKKQIIQTKQKEGIILLN